MGRTLTKATMRPLILLATVWCCSAQLVYHGYPWGPLATPLLAAPKLAGEVKTVSLAAAPLLHHPYHAALPYHTGLPLTYSVKLPEPTLESTEFPYIYTEKEESSRRKRGAVLPYAYHPLSYAHHQVLPLAHRTLLPYSAHGLVSHSVLPYSRLHTYAGVHHPLNTFGLGLQHLGPAIKIDQEPEAEEEETSSRRRRSLTHALPYLHAVPTTKKVTVETKAFEETDDATPADTKLIELTTKEHEVDVPAVKYVQPVLKYKPVTYKSHSVLPYAGLPLGYSGLHHAGLPLTYSGLHHAGLPLTYSGLHPYGLSAYSPLVKVESSDE